MLYINNTAVTPNTIEHYRLDGELGYTWKSYGPFCAYEGWHNMSYTSDANPDETSFTITDSFGLIKAQGGMDALPLSFHTLKPSKFCTPEGGLDALQLRQRNRKLIAAHDQFTPRHRLEAEGFGVPQDTWPPLTVHNNNGTHVSLRPRPPLSLTRSLCELQARCQHALLLNPCCSHVGSALCMCPCRWTVPLPSASTHLAAAMAVAAWVWVAAGTCTSSCLAKSMPCSRRRSSKVHGTLFGTAPRRAASPSHVARRASFVRCCARLRPHVPPALLGLWGCGGSWLRVRQWTDI
jgi:hypothetical protein